MDAKELMIGDYIYDLYGNKAIVRKLNDYNEHAKASGVCIELVEGAEEGKTYCLYGEIEPILLTPEIFEKNGFELHEQDTPLFTLCVYSLDDDDIALLQRPKGGWKLMLGKNTGSQQELFFGESKFVCMPIQYIHELQHALRLAGINKEIVL